MMSTDVFGKVHLGYLVIETEKFDDWRRFGRDAIGMHHDDTLPGVTRFRLDDNECRFLLQRGPAEDTTALGWEIDDHATFDTIEARVRSHGVPIAEGQKVMLLYGSANRDEREFGPGAGRLDVRRRPQRMVTFAYGAHHCLGAALARLAGGVALERLLTRFPEHEVDPERGTYAPGPFVRRYESLPFVARSSS